MTASSAGGGVRRSARALCLAVAIVAAMLLISPPTSSASGCPGAVACPYVSEQIFGDAPDALRSPTSIAVDPLTGNVFVGDTRSYRILKFDANGNLLGQIGGYGYSNGLFNGGVTGLVVAGGNLYATTYSQIQEFTLAGAFVRHAGSYGVHRDGTNPGLFVSIQGIASDGTTLYVVDSYNNRIQTYDLALTTPHVVVTGSTGGSGPGQFNSPMGDTVISGNQLYVVDRNNFRVEQFGPVTATSAPYVGSFGSQGSMANQFYYPGGITSDASGDLFIVDTYNNRISEWNNSGSWMPLRTWGGNGLTNGRFTYPTAAAADPTSGNVYVTDYANRVQKFNGTGGFLTKFGRNGDAPGRFDMPNGVAVAPNGVFYEADGNSSTVQRLSTAGAAFGGPVAGPGSSFSFGQPTGLATDGAGNLVVMDEYNTRLDVFDPLGTFLNEFNSSSGSGNGQLQYPLGIAIDAVGNIFVADNGNNRIEEFDASGNFVRAWGQAGTGGAGDLSGPNAVAVDGLGNVFVADTGYGRVDEFTSGGTFIRMWGWGVKDGASMLEVCTTGCQYGGSGPGPGALSNPNGITIAGGNVWVLDNNNYYVQGFSRTGSFVGAFGNQGNGAGQFANPQAIASDAAGNLYVADNGQNTIQKFVFPTPPAPPSNPPLAPPAPPKPTPAHGMLGKLHTLLLKSLLTGGLFVPCTSDEPATCKVMVVLGASDAKSLGLASTAAKKHAKKKYKAVVIGSAIYTLIKPGTVNLHIKLTSVGKRALRHLHKSRLTLLLTGTLTNAAGQVTPLNGSVIVKRR